jgi:hypothetical protein
MKPPFFWRGMCLYNRVSLNFVCVFLHRTYNEVRIPCSINLSVKTSTSSIDATFVVVSYGQEAVCTKDLSPHEVHMCVSLFADFCGRTF